MMTIEENKTLLTKYPFLIYKNNYNHFVAVDTYKYTMLDDCPEGWKKLFLDMCEEIRIHLEKNSVENFQFIQVKEKYGALRVYCTYCPQELHNIIDKYEDLSEYVCVNCGAVATKQSTGWICPYCDECASKLSHEKFVDIRPHI